MDAKHSHFGKDGFRLRGTKLERIDGFSDVVFGFALTLLVVSLEVPKTFAELHQSLRGFVPFAVCFLFLMMIWYAHYRYFRRFGTDDLRTIVINAGLLFVVLFYVYPLKFLFTVFSYWAMGLHTEYFESQQQVRELMLLYGVGFTAIYLLFAALYWNGWTQRRALELTEREEVLTRGYIERAAGTALVGVISCVTAVALPVGLAGFAGWVYMLISPVQLIAGRITRVRLRKLAARTGASQISAETA